MSSSSSVIVPVLAGDQTALEVAGQPVGLVGLVLEHGDALARRILHPLAGIDVAEQEVAAFVPPQRPFGRSKRPAEALAQLEDRLGRRDDGVELRRKSLDALGGLRRRAADTAREDQAARRRHRKHVPA
jgi:hypothetical protein